MKRVRRTNRKTAEILANLLDLLNHFRWVLDNFIVYHMQYHIIHHEQMYKIHIRYEDRT